MKGAGRWIRHFPHIELRCLLGIALNAALLLETGAVRAGAAACVSVLPQMRTGGTGVGPLLRCSGRMQRCLGERFHLLRTPHPRRSKENSGRYDAATPMPANCAFLIWKGRPKLGKNDVLAAPGRSTAGCASASEKTSARSRGQRQQRQNRALKRLLVRCAWFSNQARRGRPSPPGTGVSLRARVVWPNAIRGRR